MISATEEIRTSLMQELESTLSCSYTKFKHTLGALSSP